MTTHDLNKMILKQPLCCSWAYEDGSPGGFLEAAMFDFPEGLADKWKVLACTIAYNQQEVLPTYRTFERELKLPRKELQAIVKDLKEAGRLSTMPTFSEETGLISGSGFYAE